MLVIAYRNDTIQENMLFKGPSFMSSNGPSNPKRDYKVNTNILPFPTGDMKLDYLMTNVHSCAYIDGMLNHISDIAFLMIIDNIIVVW